MTSQFTLEGKVAIVTGGTGLLGKGHCKALTAAGAHVVVADLRQEACDAFASELSGMGPKAIGVAVDVTDIGSLESLRQTTLDAFGRIDGLICDAAVDDAFAADASAAELSKAENYPLEQWTRMMTVNVTGTFLAAQVIGKTMLEQGSGSIVTISSTYGLVGADQSLYKTPEGEQLFSKSPAYPTTKSALLGLTRALAGSWSPKGVRVNALCPGGVFNGQSDWFVDNYTRRTPIGRMANPDDYGGAVVYLLSDASSYMTGQSLVVDGGWTAW